MRLEKLNRIIIVISIILLIITSIVYLSSPVQAEDTITITINWNTILGDNANWYIVGVSDYIIKTDTSCTVDLAQGIYQVNYALGNRFYFNINADWTLSSSHDFVEIDQINNIFTICPRPFTIKWASQVGDYPTFHWYIAYITNSTNVSSYTTNLLPGAYHVTPGPGPNKINFTIDENWTLSSSHDFVEIDQINKIISINPRPYTITWATQMGDHPTFHWYIAYITNTTNVSSYTTNLLPGAYHITPLLGPNKIYFTIDENWTLSSSHDFVEIDQINKIISINPRPYTVTWDPLVGDNSRMSWYISYITNPTNAAIYPTNLLPGNYHISFSPDAQKIYFTVNEDWTLNSLHDYVNINGTELIIKPCAFIFKWEPQIEGAWSISYIANWIYESEYIMYLLPGSYKCNANWNRQFPFSIDESFNSIPQVNVMEGPTGSNYSYIVNIIPLLCYPPEADAGENISISTEEISITTIQGTGTDRDLDDVLEYRWLEGVNVLLNSTSVGEDGACPLDLSTYSFGLGEHTLILELTDGIATVKDETILTIENSSPHAAPTGGGIYNINEPITLGGQVSDYDGDSLLYKWMEGEEVIHSGTIETIPEGTPVNLIPYTLASLSLGTHFIIFQVDDNVNNPVSAQIKVEIEGDTTAPLLAPTLEETILWPPNHQMVDIVIASNASDNSGLAPHLTVTVLSNEPEEGLGDGDTAPDWDKLVINQETGIINLNLRSERSGSGNGRVYTIRIIAEDEAGNSNQADVEILVPHDKRKK